MGVRAAAALLSLSDCYHSPILRIFPLALTDDGMPSLPFGGFRPAAIAKHDLLALISLDAISGQSTHLVCAVEAQRRSTGYAIASNSM
jgi:hypothetical protein